MSEPSKQEMHNDLVMRRLDRIVILLERIVKNLDMSRNIGG